MTERRSSKTLREPGAGAEAFRPPSELRAIAAVFVKDVRQELRSKAVMTATLFFAGITLLIIAFAVGADETLLAVIAPGALWVALAFAGVMTASQGYASEQEDGAFEQLLMYPVPRAALFLGKLLGNWTYMVLLGLLLLPVSTVMYGASLGGRWPLLLLVIVLGTLAFSLISTFYAALTANLRARDSLLPLLMFPVIIPALLASVRASTEIMRMSDLTQAFDWLKLLTGFILVYLVVCTAIFHFIVEE
jgi:heme exporter protein B